MKTLCSAAIGLFVCCGLAGPAQARPRLPAAALRLSVPFPCGVPVRVNCGYGPHCSRAHRGHDHFALDLSRRTPGGGRGEAVTAAARGTVTFAGWALGRWAYYGKIVLLDHGQDGGGRRIQTLYAHLSAVGVSVGQQLEQGEELGKLGGSSRGQLARLGAHLHFAVLAGTGSLGTRRSLRPEPLGLHRELRAGKRLQACRRIALGPTSPIATRP